MAPAPVRLTPEEKRLYGQLFRIADADQLGVITGPVAVEFFKKSGLSPALLAEVSKHPSKPYSRSDLGDRRYR